MNGYNFTERVRKVLGMAREEAARLHHEYVGTEHILLGLIREGEGFGATVIENVGADLDDIQLTIEEIVKRGDPRNSVGPDIPYTSRAKKVLEYAMSEARELNHSYVGTEHLLLGLLREAKGIAGQVLVDKGVTLDKTRNEVLRILGEVPGEMQPVNPGGIVRRVGGRPNPGSSLPQPIAEIIMAAYDISNGAGRPQPDIADMLQAVVFSSREIAAVFAAREIEFQGMLMEIRSLLERETDRSAD